MPWMVTAPWVLIRHLRTIMASGSDAQAKLDKIVKAIAANMVAEVSSIYVRLPDGALELFATEGLRREAVHVLRMKRREGLVGLIAEWGEPVNLHEAQKHAAFSYKPETGEEAYHSFLGVPIVRDRKTLGVLTVQNKSERRYGDEEVEALQTTAMVLAEMIAAGAFAGAAPSVADKRGMSLTLKGIALAGGLAMGHISLHDPKPTFTKFFADDIQVELERLSDALDRLKIEIAALGDRSAPGTGHSDIIETLRLLANDQGWARRMREAVSAGLTAEAAVERVQQNIRTQLTRHADGFWRERLFDLDDLANRLVRALSGTGAPHTVKQLPQDAILVARNMGAAELIDYGFGKLRGLVIEDGGSEAHVAIVARSFGLAALVQTHDAVCSVEEGDPAILDAETGQLHIRPSLELIDAYRSKVQFLARKQMQFSRLSHLPAMTRDGERISLNMNAGLLVDLPNLAKSGADGIGLFRTELQFMVASKLPKMIEQEAAYARILDAAGSRRVVFRSLDVGSDKVLPYLPKIEEKNPALGWRAIRMSLDRPALFRTQVRALLRAASGRELCLMIPFVTELPEFTTAKKLIDKEIAHASRHGRALPKSLKVGIMLEIPALAYQLDDLLPLVDFVSVGSNDLFQFLFAADRENDRVSGRFDPLSPAALRLLALIAQKAAAHGVELGLCGEMAGRPIEAMALLGVGYRSISMAPASIGPVKAMVLSSKLLPLQEFTKQLIADYNLDIRKELTAYAQRQRIDI